MQPCLLPPSLNYILTQLIHPWLKKSFLPLLSYKSLQFLNPAAWKTAIIHSHVLVSTFLHAQRQTSTQFRVQFSITYSQLSATLLVFCLHIPPETPDLS